MPLPLTTNTFQKQAIVLAGGFGTRLQSIVSDVPKPMAIVAGRPFLEYLLDTLSQNGFQKVVLSVGYMHEIILQHFGDSYKNLTLKYAIENEPLGTGGAVKNALQFIDSESFVLMNGDTFFDVNFEQLSQDFTKNKAQIQLSLKPMQAFDRYGTVQIDEAGRVEGFLEKQYKGEGIINGGVYVIHRSVFDDSTLPTTFSFENAILETKHSSLAIYGSVFDEYFIDIGVPEDYAKVQINPPHIVKTRHALSLPTNGSTVTIITVTYNAAADLPTTIESVLAQTYTNIEYLIVDGNSTDGTLDIIKNYEDKLSGWISEPDKGIYDAMNKGIALAKGKAILLLNAGDTLEPTAIEKMVKTGGQNLENAYICCDWVVASASKDVEVHRQAEFILNKRNGICHQGALVGRNIYRKFGLYDTSLRLVADYDFHVRVWRQQPQLFVRVPEMLCNFKYEGATTQQNLKGNLERWRVINRHFAWYEAWHIRFVTAVAIIIRTLLKANRG